MATSSCARDMALIFPHFCCTPSRFSCALPGKHSNSVTSLEWPHDLTPIALPSLILLEIQSHGFSPRISDFLTIIYAPRMQSLLLDDFVGEDVEDLTSIFRCPRASRNYLSLHCLEIRDAILSEVDAAELAASTPAVVDLKPTDSVWWKQISNSKRILAYLSTVTDISPNLGGVLPWPDLLSIALTSISDECLRLLREIVSNRIKCGRPLTSLTIPMPGGSDNVQSHLAWLQQHVQVTFIRDPIEVTWSSCSARSLHSFRYRDRILSYGNNY